MYQHLWHLSAVQTFRCVPDPKRQCYSPATVIPSMRNVGDAIDPRNSRSFPISLMFENMSFRFPATVISSTGNVSSPFSIHIPLAPREKSPVTRLTPNPRNSVTSKPSLMSPIISFTLFAPGLRKKFPGPIPGVPASCLLYTSDAADEEDSVDLGGR